MTKTKTSIAIFSHINPLFPSSEPATGSSSGLHPKSKFLAVILNQRITMKTLLTLTTALLSLTALPGHGAGVISFNFTGDGSPQAGMTPTDLAGAPGVRVGNYNNIIVPHSGTSSVTVTTVKDNTGATVTGAALAFTYGSGFGTFGDSFRANDARLFSRNYDQYGAPASTISLTNIPFALYDVYFYRHTDGALRAGQFTVGGNSLFVRGGLTDPNDTGTGYVESMDTTNTGALITQGNYVVFRNVSGSTLDASFLGLDVGDGNPRNKVVGFQVAEAVPEPSSIALLGLSGLALMFRRRR